MRLSVRESDIQKAILDYLLMRGHWVWRQSVGGMAQESQGKKRFIRFGKRGLADITGIEKASGRRIEIEVKRPGNRATDAQESFLAEVRKRKGIAFVAYSVDDVAAVGL